MDDKPSGRTSGLCAALDELDADRNCNVLAGLEIGDKGSVSGSTQSARVQPLPDLNDIAPDRLGEGSSILKVAVDKQPGTLLGLALCVDDGENLVICGLYPGLVQQWNLGRAKNNQVSVGDCILSVNGETGDCVTLKHQMNTASGMFTFDVRTHREYSVTVSKGVDDQLGLDVGHQACDQTLLVKSVVDGLVSVWNDVHTRIDEKVVPGDRVLKVNQGGGTGQELRSKLKESRGIITLLMIRNASLAQSCLDDARFSGLASEARMCSRIPQNTKLPDAPCTE